MLATPDHPVPLTVGRYLLDAASDQDVDAVADAFADPDIALWNPGARRPGSTPRERAALWVADRRAWAPDHCSWVVRDPDGLLVGQVSIHSLDEEIGSGEVGYWLTPAGRGRGVGAAAVDAASRFAFDVVGLARIELFHAVENMPSCRLAERCGYLVEGTARQSFVYGDGLRHDEHLHARLASDDVAPVPAPL
jgi:RimJ/RimL family protein N-acetyltransferase